MKVTGCLLVSATVISAGAFVWSVVAFVGCCCRSCLTEPLPSTAVVAMLNALSPPIVVGVYKESGEGIGYSMICAIVAIIALFLASLSGCLAAMKKEEPKLIVVSRRWEPPPRQQASGV